MEKEIKAILKNAIGNFATEKAGGKMSKVSKSLIKGLLAVNCKYNNVPQENGKCYSTECMLNQNKVIAADIQKKGCIIWTKLPKI